MTETTSSRYVLAAVVTLALAVVTVTSSRATAQETVPPPAPSSPPMVGGSVGYFGEHGQIVISGDFRFHVMRESLSMDGGSTTSYELQPAVDYFVSSNVSVGGLLGIAGGPFAPGVDISTFMIGPRIGYNLVLTNAVSLWIRGGFRYERDSFSGTADETGWRLPLFAQAHLLWHPASHFFIGAGPFISTDLVAKIEGADVSKRTDIGLGSTIGGYFGGL